MPIYGSLSCSLSVALKSSVPLSTANRAWFQTVQTGTNFALQSPLAVSKALASVRSSRQSSFFDPDLEVFGGKRHEISSSIGVQFRR